MQKKLRFFAKHTLTKLNKDSITSLISKFRQRIFKLLQRDSAYKIQN